MYLPQPKTRAGGADSQTLKEFFMEVTKLEKGLFILDAYEDEAFEGYAQGQYWNGFECPLFSFSSAQRIAAVLGVAQVAFYDEASDQFVFAYEEDEDDADRFGPIQVEGLGKLYPIGTGVWAWSKK